MWADWLGVAAAVFVLAALVDGSWSLINTEKRLTAQRDLLISLTTEAGNSRVREQSAWLNARLQGSGVPFVTYGDALLGKQDAELVVVRYLRPTLTRPFVWAWSGRCWAWRPQFSMPSPDRCPADASIRGRLMITSKVYRTSTAQAGHVSTKQADQSRRADGRARRRHHVKGRPEVCVRPLASWLTQIRTSARSVFVKSHSSHAGDSVQK
jgi:hypothetical protein